MQLKTTKNVTAKLRKPPCIYLVEIANEHFEVYIVVIYKMFYPITHKF
jgi:hypothetical protein